MLWFWKSDFRCFWGGLNVPQSKCYKIVFICTCVIESPSIPVNLNITMTTGVIYVPVSPDPFVRNSALLPCSLDVISTFSVGAELLFVSLQSCVYGREAEGTRWGGASLSRYLAHRRRDRGGPVLSLGCVGPPRIISKGGDQDASCSRQGQAEQHSARWCAKCSFHSRTRVLLLELCCLSLLALRGIANKSFVWRFFLQCK